MAFDPIELPPTMLARLRADVADYFSHQTQRFDHAGSASAAGRNIWSAVIDILGVLIEEHNANAQFIEEERQVHTDRGNQIASLQATVGGLARERDDLRAQLTACQLDVHAAERRIAALEAENARSAEA